MTDKLMPGLPAIRKAHQGDSRAIATLHCRRILSGLLTALGEPFTAVFYQTMIGSPVGFAYVATEVSRVVGFASGLVDGQRFYQDSLDRALGNVADTALAALIHGRWKNLAQPPIDGEPVELPPAEVVSIAVEPGALEEPTSVELVRHVLEEFAIRGVGRVWVTAEASNESAGRVYEQAGFHRYAEVRLRPMETAIIYVASLDGVGRYTRSPAS